MVRLQEINKLKNVASELYSNLSTQEGSIRLEDWNQLKCDLPDDFIKSKTYWTTEKQFKAYLQLVMQKQSYVLKNMT